MRFTTLLTVSEVRLKFPKFATNLAISFRSCQSNREREFHAELRWEVIKFIAVKLSRNFLIHCGHVDYELLVLK